MKRFQAVSFFLTYPRINDDTDDARLRLLQFLQQLGTTNETQLSYALIARESHQGGGGGTSSDTGTIEERCSSVGTLSQGWEHSDGGPRLKHWHVVAHYSSKLRLGERAFDFEGNHPNIRTIGRKKSDWNNVTTYCRKEDSSPLEFGTPRFEGHSVWKEVAESKTRLEAEEILLREKPRDWIINRRSIDYALDKMFPMQENAPLYLSRCSSQFSLPDELEEWKLNNFV